jgi:hypothetical protein
VDLRRGDGDQLVAERVDGQVAVVAVMFFSV